MRIVDISLLVCSDNHQAPGQIIVTITVNIKILLCFTESSSMDILTIILLHWMILLLEVLVNQEMRDRTNPVGMNLIIIEMY